MSYLRTRGSSSPCTATPSRAVGPSAARRSSLASPSDTSARDRLADAAQLAAGHAEGPDGTPGRLGPFVDAGAEAPGRRRCGGLDEAAIRHVTSGEHLQQDDPVLTLEILVRVFSYLPCFLRELRTAGDVLNGLTSSGYRICTQAGPDRRPWMSPVGDNSRLHVCPLVFHRTGERILTFRKAWTVACEAAGCPGKLIHDMRRSAVRTFERAGVPRSVAMSIVGHKTESIYRRYAIVDEAVQREAAARLEAWMAVPPAAPPTATVAALVRRRRVQRRVGA